MENVVSTQTKEPSVEDNLVEDICLFDDSDDNSDMEVSKESSELLGKTWVMKWFQLIKVKRLRLMRRN